MNRVYIKDLEKHFNEEVEVQGFVENIRNLQWVAFVIIRDNTGKVQVTIEKSEESNKEMIDIISSLNNESTVKVIGKILESPKVKLGGKEIIPSSIVVTSKALESELPINIKDKYFSYLYTNISTLVGNILITTFEPSNGGNGNRLKAPNITL